MPASRGARGERGPGRYAPDDYYERTGRADDWPGEEEEDVERGRRRGRERPARRLTALTAGQAGARYIAELTGKDVEGVTMVKPAGDGWTVEVEVVEDHRVPSSGDTLGVYALDLDSEGDLVSYRRARSFRRAKGDTGGVY
ncbi:gas vesicle protein GvpO [Sphaerisporangium fuscum]|uniref:gas vesicle protein GvpO n=1 Tax=Sphaerisporangium fuscum TaxID=2835868 RepID=UPI001BDC9E62|nr:gas vesicle protein GvpO [Sphaerisporangium fuscum]